ncbi:MAG TPA: hypothetical protein VJ376_16180, partial [Pseudomonadota bacterium]|nr:hypothetical protein [Pseudomonadota bacterium]
MPEFRQDDPATRQPRHKTTAPMARYSPVRYKPCSMKQAATARALPASIDATVELLAGADYLA